MNTRSLRPWTVLLLSIFGPSFSLPALPAAIPAPRDAAYPGVISLAVDATDVAHRIYSVRETIPAKPGPLTLLYPEWLPGNHAPRGPISALAGLVIQAQGKRLEWIRDPVEVYAFHVTVPPGASQVDVEFQFVSPTATDQGRVTVTPDILGVQWNTVVLYPAGHYSSRINLEPTLTLPEGWQFACALDVATREGAVVRFKRTTLETLVDSPLFAGHYTKRMELASTGQSAPRQPPLAFTVFADSPDEINITPEQIEPHRRLVEEAGAVFGAWHFDHYELMLSVSENFGTIGLEHHRSSENGVRKGYFKDWDKTSTRRDLLSHEFTHSWNGKFRRPADLWTANFNVPMRDSLLWVYEGMTQYWGEVLAARSGLWNDQMTRDAIASLTAVLQERRAGRKWRDLQDTTQSPITASRSPLPWTSWQRPEDYYNEGLLIWLDVDTKLRELSTEKHSLDDFARAFLGIDNGSYVPATYTFDDIVKTLNGVVPYDWATFLHTRLESNGPDAPLGGLERAGWKLVFRDEPSAFSKQVDELNETTEFAYSIGLVLGKEARLNEVVWDSAAFKSGLTVGMTLVAVNGRAYKAEYLKQAIRDAKSNGAPLELLVKSFDRYQTVPLTYHEGLRYPHLARIDGTPDRLSAILRPLTYARAAAGSP